ncbi:hypothetical protein FHW69_003751 [Luteibacter sp. Sphag1AF]|uniref:hypothetical protein n=1 Tax=Luteibacter sp. Sphag1AF TaxID=2587031 RepID=UPI0016143FF9|nr:hypothetical protein [Luteibacter sp. Sphag1AF]MBB3229099.1 hypothetical protein [Luteibacter sp. Sphag1AF]
MVSASALTDDIYAALILEMSKEYGVYGETGAFAVSDEQYASYVLLNPSSPYSRWKDLELRAVDWPMTRAIERAQHPDHPISPLEATRLQTWDLGYTKAELPDDGAVPNDWYGTNTHNLYLIANAMKAGIDGDIYEQAALLAGQNNPIIAGNFAVAAQILRRKMLGVPRQQHARLGLREDVLNHFLLARDERDLSEFDAFYLMQILDAEMATWRVGHANGYGKRDLQATFRVARATASYIPPRFPGACLTNGQHDPVFSLEPGVAPCFNDATDRAVFRWYAREFHTEIVGSANGGPRLPPLSRAVAMSRQGGWGTHSWSGFDESTRIEWAEARIARKLFAEGDVPYHTAAVALRKAMQLTCWQQGE